MTSDLAEFLDQAFIDTLHRAHLVLVERAEAGELFSKNCIGDPGRRAAETDRRVCSSWRRGIPWAGAMPELWVDCRTRVTGDVARRKASRRVTSFRFVSRRFAFPDNSRLPLKSGFSSRRSVSNANQENLCLCF